MGEGVVQRLKRKAVSRAPSAAAAAARRALAQRRAAARARAAQAEARHRAAGGYGRATASPWEVPRGGIGASPAYQKVLARCGCTGPRPPAPGDRAGAPLRGGFPLEKWPPNVLVDGQRRCWLPDDWGQAIKNTGRGGTYLGWVSPEGKFFYHRSGYPTAIEETIGRKLTARDGFNGVLRSVKQLVPPGADQAFLDGCLSTDERNRVLGAKHFHFAVISARRATSDEGQLGIMTVEAHFNAVGVKPTWYVDAESLQAYKSLGLSAVVGGKLTPARNLALDDAKSRRQVCVQISDDISKWEYFDVERQDFGGETSFQRANAAVCGAKRLCVSPLAAAQFILAKMRSSPSRPHLGGVFPTRNASMSLGQEEYSTHHFILGDFFVAEPASTCRFDTAMSLKEDYDFTCRHLEQHGSVLRCNRMFAHARHASNAGGAVATRDATGARERENIAILMRKWPGSFYLNGKRKDEVVLKWARGAASSSTRSAGGGGGGSACPKAKRAAARDAAGCCEGRGLTAFLNSLREPRGGARPAEQAGPAAGRAPRLSRRG